MLNMPAVAEVVVPESLVAVAAVAAEAAAENTVAEAAVQEHYRAVVLVVALVVRAWAATAWCYWSITPRKIGILQEKLNK